MRVTSSLDIVAGELTHGVTKFSRGQSGALNQSISNVFGSMVKQWALGQSVDQAHWLIGATILGPDIHRRAIVDMANPGTAFDDPKLGKDQQPGHMRNYVQTSGDNGGVHINPGFPTGPLSSLRKRSVGTPGKRLEKFGT